MHEKIKQAPYVGIDCAAWGLRPCFTCKAIAGAWKRMRTSQPHAPPGVPIFQKCYPALAVDDDADVLSVSKLAVRARLFAAERR